jgi:hypothetical protein
MSETESGPDLRRYKRLPLPPIILGVGSILWKLAGYAERIDFILRAQDQTFAVAFQAFLSYGWLILALGSALWAFLVAREQPVQAEGGFKATPGMVVAIGILAFIYGVLLAVRATGSIPNVTAAWGPTPTGCQIGVDTSRLSTFRDQYYLVGVCGLTDPSTDVLQQTGITISKPFTITPGGVNIFAPYSAVMANTIKGLLLPTPATPGAIPPASGAAPSGGANPASVVAPAMWYQPVLVPKEIDFTKIATLSDIKKQGGKILSPAYFE